MNKSKFYIKDIASNKILKFIPKRTQTLFETKIPTYKQFFDDIKHTGNIAVYYKNRLLFVRYY